MKPLSFSIFLTFLFSYFQSVGQSAPPYQFSDSILFQLETDSVPWKHQVAAWEFSFIGAYDDALQAWDEGHGTRNWTEADSLHFLEFNPIDARAYLQKLLPEEQIVIINEAHHQPYHRALVRSWLQMFYDAGYRYLGMETLDEKDTELQERKYPLISSGYYSKEPQFGNLIREAIEMGFTVFPYEAKSGANGKDREIGQAKNIQAFWQKDTLGKYLIYCGFAHLKEGPVRKWEKAMAGRLKEYTGVDPFTINQVLLTETSSLKQSHPIRREVELLTPSFFLKGDSLYVGRQEDHQYDALLYLPSTRMTFQGRPEWMNPDGQHKAYYPEIPEGLGYPRLIFVYPEGEPEGTVPVDIVELKNKENKLPLILRPGTYRIVVKTPDNAVHTLTFTAN